MRLASYTAATLLTAAVGATIAYAFFFIEFLIIMVIIVTLVAVGSVAGKGQQRVAQKTTFQMDRGTAFISHGETAEDPDAVNFTGGLVVRKSRPAPMLPADLSEFGIAFPMTKTNGGETKGSLKARWDVLSDSVFRSEIENFLNTAANLETETVLKTQSGFIGGNITMTDAKQSGSVKVDTKTFSRLAGKVALKGKGTVTGGPNDGAELKFKIKVKFKPRKAEF